MHCYIIHYRISNNDSEEKCRALETAIKSYKDYAHVLTSCWAILSDQTCEEIRDFLIDFIDEEKDSLFVVRSGVEAAWINAFCTDDWLQKYL